MRDNIINKTWIKGQPSPYQLEDITHFPEWKGMIVADAFFNNLTSALAIITAIFWIWGPHELEIILPFAITTTLLILILDLILLVFDLADPIRFFHSLRVIHFTSALSVGVWALSFFGVFLFCGTVLSWIVFYISSISCPFIIIALRNVCITLAILSAIAVICYKGVVFSCSSQPGVKDGRWLTSFFVSDSLLMGLSVYIIIAAFFLPQIYFTLFVTPAIILILIHCLTFKLLWNDVKTRVEKIYKNKKLLISLSVYALGGLLPLILTLCGKEGLIIAAFCILISGIFSRYWIIGLARPHSLIKEI